MFIKRVLPHKLITIIPGFILAFTAVLTFHACETITEIDLPEEKPVLVINSVFDADSLVQVNLTQSQPINNKSLKYKVVENASIELLKNTTSLGLLEYKGKGNYFSETKLLDETNVKYSLKIRAAGFETAEASEIVPHKPSVSSVSLELDNQNSNGVYKTYKAVLTLNDTPEDNYYFLKVWLIYPNGLKTKIDYSLKNNLGLVTVAFAERQLQLFDDKSFNGKPVILTLDIFESYVYDKGNFKILIELGSTTKNYFDFQNSVRKQLQGDPILNSSDYPVSNNIKNGLGIFAPYNAASIIFDVVR